MGMKMTLNDLEKIFVDNYFRYQGNASRAYRETFNCTTEESCKRSPNLLKKKCVSEEIKRRKEELNKSPLTKEEMLETLRIIKDSNIFDYYKYKTEYKEKMNYDTGKIEVIEIEKRTLKKKSELTIPQQLAVKKIVKTKESEEVELYSKEYAIDKICKLLGFDENTFNLNTTLSTGKLSDMSTEDLINLLNK